MKNVAWYFTYSSNMNSARLAGRGIKFISKEVGYIDNYQLKFNKKSVDGTSKANIVPAKEEKVYGVLYKLPADQLTKLDNIEGVTSGHYVRQPLSVCSLNDEVFMAQVYIANAKYLVDENDIRPSNNHISTLISAAIEHKINTEYIDYLRSFLRADED